MEEAKEQAKVLVLAEFDDFDLCMPEGGTRGIDSFWRKNASYDAQKDKRRAPRQKKKVPLMPRVEIQDEVVVLSTLQDPILAAMLRVPLRAPTSLVPLSVLEAEATKAERQQAVVHAERERELAAVIPIPLPLPPSLPLASPIQVPIKLKPLKLVVNKRLDRADDYDDREMLREREIESNIAASVARRPPVYQGVKGGMLLAGYVR